jgi:hypothetical protein
VFGIKKNEAFQSGAFTLHKALGIDKNVFELNALAYHNKVKKLQSCAYKENWLILLVS